jgi:mono/diheme cytochrome c family protein
MRARLLTAAGLAVGLAGCAASPHSRAGGGVTALQVRAVDWNPGQAPITGVRAVADSGSDVVAFADGAATVLTGGRVVAVDHSVPRWISAGTLPAADGSGTWIVGVDGDGRVRRLFGKATLEPVSDRFGLTNDQVTSVATLGSAVAGFRLRDQIAVADGASVTRYATGLLASFAGGGGRAALGGDPLRVFDVAGKHVSAFAVPDISSAGGPGRAAFVAMTPQGKLFVATPETIWAEDERGDLAVRFEARGMTIHGLAASADRVWFADGSELGVIEGAAVRETTGAHVSPAAELAASPSGDVWTLTGGALARYAVADVSAAAPAWDETVAPVFRRACESCHKAGGEAGVALGTKEAWEKRRDRIRRRVLVDRDMPPAGHALSDAEREAIRAWLGR